MSSDSPAELFMEPHCSYTKPDCFHEVLACSRSRTLLELVQSGEPAAESLQCVISLHGNGGCMVCGGVFHLSEVWYCHFLSASE